MVVHLCGLTTREHTAAVTSCIFTSREQHACGISRNSPSIIKHSHLGLSLHLMRPGRQPHCCLTKCLKRSDYDYQSTFCDSRPPEMLICES
jgi:hypothetical protein